MARNRKRVNAVEGKGRKREAKRKPSQTAFSPTVSIIGAGKLGTALAVALSATGCAVESVVSRRIQKARRAARLIGPETHAYTLAQLSDLPPSKILFITTPDDAIESVAAQLAGSIKSSGRGRVALHASGALSSEALISLRAIGFHTGSMHPLISVSDPLAGALNLGLGHFCVEGQPQAVRVARSLVRSLGGRSFSISTRDKALYHAAAVMSSGHMVALFDIATEMLKRCGLTARQATEALLPLLTSTVENLTHNSPGSALTGTFARADTETVVKHLTALRGTKKRDAIAAYTLLGMRSLQLARENGADRTNVNQIKHILGEIKKGVGNSSRSFGDS